MTVRFNKQTLNNIKEEVVKVIAKETYALDAEAKDLIFSTAKTGRVYTRGGVTHQASAPGEPFANDTGEAVSKMRVSSEEGGLTGVLTFGARYSRALEFGTRKMEPRPVARPALEKRRPMIEENIQAGIKRGMAKSDIR